jgi:hypothetical protein
MKRNHQKEESAGEKPSSTGVHYTNEAVISRKIGSKTPGWGKTD